MNFSFNYVVRETGNRIELRLPNEIPAIPVNILIQARN